MPASPIRKLVPLANAAKARGTHVYHLNIGQPDLPTPEEGLEALRHIDRKVLEYSPSEGLLSLRQKLADYYHRFNINVDVEDIIVTSGGSEAVLFAFMACLDPGDEIIVPEPAYANYMAFAISAGAKIVTVPSSIDEGFALPPMEKFEELITTRTKGILICNPNNPRIAEHEVVAHKQTAFVIPFAQQYAEIRLPQDGMVALAVFKVPHSALVAEWYDGCECDVVKIPFCL